MKTKMLIFVFLLGITDLFAQTLYVPGTIVKGKNASYYCSTKYEILIKVNNVNNVDTTTTMYYDDGTVVPFDEGSAVIETTPCWRLNPTPPMKRPSSGPTPASARH